MSKKVDKINRVWLKTKTTKSNSFLNPQSVFPEKAPLKLELKLDSLPGLTPVRRSTKVTVNKVIWFYQLS